MTARHTVRIAGDVYGQVAAGEFVYQAQSIGGVINQIVIEGPVVVARPLPVSVIPSLAPGYVHRIDDEHAVIEALAAGPVQVFGDDGIGKTRLVEYLAHHPELGQEIDGVAYIDVRGRPVEDALLAVFDTFYRSRLSNLGLRPGDSELRDALTGRRAVLVLDHLEVPRTDLDHLLQVLASATVLMASEHETLLGSGSAIRLRGLSPQAAAEVFEFHVRRSVDRVDHEVIVRFCEAVDGHPATVVRAACAVRRNELEIAELGRFASHDYPGRALARLCLDSLTDLQRQALETLAAVHPAALPADAIEALTGADAAIIEELRARHLVLAASPQVRLAGDVMEAAALPDVRASVLAGIGTWLEQAGPESVVAASEAIDVITAWGTETGHAQEVLTVARASAPPLASTRAWGMLRRVLERARTASRMVSEPASEGWALHELGTLEACAGEREGAVALLRQAEVLRRTAGDNVGAEVTRHNLEQLGLPGPPVELPSDEAPPARPPNPPRRSFLRFLTITVAVAAIVAGVLAITRPSPDGNGERPRIEGAALVVNTDPISFGVVEPGEIRTEQRRLSNSGEAPTVVDMTWENGFPFVVDGCSGVTIGPEEACTATIRFTAGEPGRFEDVLVIEHDAGAGAIYIAVQAEVPGDDAPVQPRGETGPGRIEVNPPEVRFGSLALDELGREWVRIENVSDEQVTVSGIWLESGSQFSADGECARVFDPGDECEIEVVAFAEEPGSFEDWLVVAHNGEGSELRVRLQAEVVAPEPVGAGVLQAKPSSVGLGIVQEDEETPIEIRIYNVGAGPAMISGVSLEEGEVFRITGHNCPDVLPSQSWCDLDMTAVAETVGEFVDNLMVAYDGSESPLVVTLSLAGVDTAS